MKNPKRVPVTMRALLQRINRKFESTQLAEHDGLQIRKARGREADSIGPFFLLQGQNYVKASGVDPEEIGRDLKVIAPWEVVVD